MPIFEWDEAKREINLAKHRLDFLDAIGLFDGRPVIAVSSTRGSEVRYLSTGLLNGAMCSVVWTWRGVSVRLISFRRARENEARAYHEAHGAAGPGGDPSG